MSSNSSDQSHSIFTVSNPQIPQNENPSWESSRPKQYAPSQPMENSQAPAPTMPFQTKPSRQTSNEILANERFGYKNIRRQTVTKLVHLLAILSSLIKQYHSSIETNHGATLQSHKYIPQEVLSTLSNVELSFLYDSVNQNPADSSEKEYEVQELQPYFKKILGLCHSLQNCEWYQEAVQVFSQANKSDQEQQNTYPLTKFSFEELVHTAIELVLANRTKDFALQKSLSNSQADIAQKEKDIKQLATDLSTKQGSLVDLEQEVQVLRSKCKDLQKNCSQMAPTQGISQPCSELIDNNTNISNIDTIDTKNTIDNRSNAILSERSSQFSESHNISSQQGGVLATPVKVPFKEKKKYKTKSKEMKDSISVYSTPHHLNFSSMQDTMSYHQPFHDSTQQKTSQPILCKVPYYQSCPVSVIRALQNTSALREIDVSHPLFHIFGFTNSVTRILPTLKGSGEADIARIDPFEVVEFLEEEKLARIPKLPKMEISGLGDELTFRHSLPFGFTTDSDDIEKEREKYHRKSFPGKTMMLSPGSFVTYKKHESIQLRALSFISLQCFLRKITLVALEALKKSNTLLPKLAEDLRSIGGTNTLANVPSIFSNNGCSLRPHLKSTLRSCVYREKGLSTAIPFFAAGRDWKTQEFYPVELYSTEFHPFTGEMTEKSVQQSQSASIEYNPNSDKRSPPYLSLPLNTTSIFALPSSLIVSSPNGIGNVKEGLNHYSFTTQRFSKAFEHCQTFSFPTTQDFSLLSFPKLQS